MRKSAATNWNERGVSSRRRPLSESVTALQESEVWGSNTLTRSSSNRNSPSEATNRNISSVSPVSTVAPKAFFNAGAMLLCAPFARSPSPQRPWSPNPCSAEGIAGFELGCLSPASMAARSAAKPAARLATVGGVVFQFISGPLLCYVFSSCLRRFGKLCHKVWHKKRWVLHLYSTWNAANRPVLDALHTTILRQPQQLSNLSWATEAFNDLRVLMFGHGRYYTPCLFESQSPCVTTWRVFF